MQTETIRGSERFRALLGSVVRRNGGKWFRFILTILKNEADAEDVIQEAVRRVLSRNVPLHSEEQIRMYLGRAVANAALELYNCRKRERLRHLSLPRYPEFSRPLAHLDETDRLRDRERLIGLLDQGLKRLPPKQYEALRLTILQPEELSIRDAGAISGIPYSTLRHRSRQGLKRLGIFLRRSARNQESEVRIQNERQGEDIF